MKQSYIVQLYIRCLFKWKLHDFYPYRAYALKAGRALESVGIKIKLIQVSSDGEKDLIYETREDLRSPSWKRSLSHPLRILSVNHPVSSTIVDYLSKHYCAKHGFLEHPF